jgi:hypothetical protein
MNVINFKLIPVDTLVEVKIRPNDQPQTAYFAGIIDPKYDFCVFPEGASSKTNRHKNIELTGQYFRLIRISNKNPWLPWFGGDCPVPPNYMVDVILRDTSLKYPQSLAGMLMWSHVGYAFENDIIAYRLAESAWQTTAGVCDERE